MPVLVVNIPWATRRSDTSGDESELSDFQTGVKPFMVCMKLTGLHSLNWTGHDGGKVRRKLVSAYRVFVPLLLLANFVFSLGEFNRISEFNAALLNNMISSIWFLQVAVFSVNNAIRCGHWQRFYDAWDKYMEENKLDSRTLVRKISIVLVVCYLVWLLLAVGFMAISITSPTPPSGFTIYIPQDFIVFVMVFICLAYVYFVTTWFLMTSQFAMTCVSICKLLHGLYNNIKRCLDNDESMGEQIEKLRRRHEQICSMINLADDILSVFIMVTVFTTIPLIVLTLYFVLFVADDAETFSYTATWWSISLSTLQLTAVFLFGGTVNYMAHRPSTLLYRLDLSHMAHTSVLQLSVFLNRLTSQPIGMTAFGLFVLDKPTIITFVGSIATYAIVLVQFKPGDSTPSFVGNCTDT